MSKQVIDASKLAGDPRFYELLVELAELNDRKCRDYTGSNEGGGDPFRNFRACEEFGVPMPLGILVRMSDKWTRIGTLIKRRYETGEGPRVADESLADTLKDFAVYALLELIALEREPGRFHSGDDAPAAALDVKIA